MKISVAVLFLCYSSICTLQWFVEGACPIGWKSYESDCYVHLTTKTGQNFNYWKSHCVSLGGHLASIHSSAELNAIKGMISSGPNTAYYIGLNDISREGRWEYTDGTTANYYNWNSGEPSRQTDEDCTVMNINGFWFDERCSTLHGGICKIGIGCNLPVSWDSHLNVAPNWLFYHDGDSVSYSCDEGYYLEGESSATCEDGEFDPPEAPECAEQIECHTWRNVACDPSSEICGTSGNTEKTTEICEEPIKQCFVHQYTIKGDGVTVDATAGGCVTNSDLELVNGCYERSFLSQIDPSGNDELSQLEEAIGVQSDDVNVCVCDRDICNESVETAERNSATISATMTKFLLTLASIFTIITCSM